MSVRQQEALIPRFQFCLGKGQQEAGPPGSDPLTRAPEPVTQQPLAQDGSHYPDAHVLGTMNFLTYSQHSDSNRASE